MSRGGSDLDENGGSRFGGNQHAQILDVGPTSSEVLDAYTWLRADDRLEGRLERELHGKAARVFEILEQDDADGDDRTR
ncbi:hypothetical protein [Burkholderia stagnalis]|uniref:hypothetical protein n=1 Tax=Burkholderia stagnalis TaxID=1503054 RepID=UPI0021AB1E3C|nr:hypothetical protein [Burkholderia stagnalis]